MGTASSYHNYLSLWKGMAILNNRGELRQRAGKDEDNRAAAWAGTLTKVNLG